MSKKIEELFIGRLGRDPDLKYTKKLKPVCHLAVGVNDSEKAVWKKVVVRGEQAEICKTHLKKGHRVFVKGNTRVQKYLGRDGKEKNYVEVSAQLIGFTNYE